MHRSITTIPTPNTKDTIQFLALLPTGEREVH